MFTTVVVPLDGSQEATAALPTARAIAVPVGARMSLVRVVRRPAGSFASHADEMREAATYLDGIVHKKLHSAELSISTHVRSGEIAAEILNQVHDVGPDVIVMATRGRGGVRRAVLGSVASELVAESPVPVILLRTNSHLSPTLKALLVPLDGSPESAEVLPSATALARATGAHVLLLRVVTPVPAWVLQQSSFIYDAGLYLDPDWDNAAYVEARNYVMDLAARLTLQGISADGLALIGDVARTSTRTAVGVKADLVVMSMHGRTGAARAVLGSVADTVVRSSLTPVMLLRGDSTATVEDKSGEELAVV
jgi:nucleotide-binding universal stress UspA family protein